MESSELQNHSVSYSDSILLFTDKEIYITGGYMIKPWSHSQKVSSPGLEPRSLRLKILCFQPIALYCLSQEIQDSYLLTSWLGVSDKPTGMWHFYQEFFSFSLLNGKKTVCLRQKLRWSLPGKCRRWKEPELLSPDR